VDDITPATPRMTYAESRPGAWHSAKSAERLAQRRRWPRQIGNDGMARVLVPLGEDSVTPRHRGPSSPPDVAERRGETSAPDIGDIVRAAIREAVTPLAAELEHERARADRAEQCAGEAQAAERKAIELVKFVTAEASEQRRKADEAQAAERIARDEAAGLRARLDQLTGRGWWARLRNKT
jgi:hypothetical protein